jgi:hypothetical protein
MKIKPGIITLGILLYFVVTVYWQQTPSIDYSCVILTKMDVFNKIISFLRIHLFILFWGILCKKYIANWSIDILACWCLIFYEGIAMIGFDIWLTIADYKKFNNYCQSKEFSLILSIGIFVLVGIIFIINKSWKKRVG